MLKGTDKLNEFPQHFNKLEEQVKSLEELSKNTRGIKIATWITAISTAILAIVGILALLL